MAPAPRKILVVRNDKLGDFMLAFPTFATLKQALAGSEIHALVPAYTQPMAELCEWIDKTIVDPGKAAGLQGWWQLRAALTEQHYDAVITLYSTPRIGAAALAAGIPYRLAPATKIAQIYYNHRLRQRRSRSIKPEFEYNRDLALQFLQDWGVAPPDPLPQPPFLRFDAARIDDLRQRFCEEHAIASAHKLVFMHPGHGGSASYLSLEQFTDLAAGLKSPSGHTIVISAGPGEFEIANALRARLADRDVAHRLYVSSQGLANFAAHLAFADVFISGSTGPLHIAGALNRPTVGFYPRTRVMSALRWQTLSVAGKRLAYWPQEPAGEEEMASIDVTPVAREISARFLAG